jgi:hypothetical protein
LPGAVPAGAAPGCGSTPRGTSPALGWSEIAVKKKGGRQGGTTTGLLTKKHQNVIF